MSEFRYKATLKHTPELDEEFRPIVLDNREYINAIDNAGDSQIVKIALERNEGCVSVIETKVFGNREKDQNMIYVERLVKTILWLKGGWRLFFAGPEYIGEFLKEAYSEGGIRSFDAKFMSKVYDKAFVIEILPIEKMPKENEAAKPVGRNINGYRIGFDAGGSDRKVSAVIDGNSVYSEEVVWHPKMMSDPKYHYQGIMDSIKRAAAQMPKVDAIGVSAAGVYINNQVKAASLFLKVSSEDFDKHVKNIFIDVSKELGVPIEVTNDGDVTALAGAMSLDKNCVLGIAMGTSEAAGYVNEQGYITGWLNELAFVPIDYSPIAMIDEWSGDIGCGVKYFSQDGVIKLALKAGIMLDKDKTPAENLKVVQDLMKKDDQRATKIYESIGCYLGYAIAYYAQFYKINYVLLLGRVTSGRGGMIILKKAQKVLKEEFSELHIKVIMPDEKSRRVGQSLAAASLPKVNI